MFVSKMESLQKAPMVGAMHMKIVIVVEITLFHL